ncbi:hypothetical protein KY289_019907 [Solanum tuberosum]|nr:hypothetical protein KY289_019907 [Solanum tuberosum]
MQANNGKREEKKREKSTSLPLSPVYLAWVYCLAGARWWRWLLTLLLLVVSPGCSPVELAAGGDERRGRGEGKERESRRSELPPVATVGGKEREGEAAAGERGRR